MAHHAEHAPRSTLAPALAGGIALLVLAILAAYANTLHHPLIFDDVLSFTKENTPLQSVSAALNPPGAIGLPLEGRPLLSLSFSLNHALTGDSIAAYRLTNILIHAAAAVVLLLGIRLAVRRHGPAWLGNGDWFALSVAALWALHPLNTESVSYLVQRAESLAGLLYFLALYCFLRSTEAGRRAGWRVLTVLVCLLGVTAKETVATAPVLMLLLDRAFIAGSFAAALQARGRFYAATLLAWVVVGAFMFSTHSRGNTVGFAGEVAAWPYFLKQVTAIWTYLRLVILPHPLILDYGKDVIADARSIWPQLLALVALGTLVLVALWRWPKTGTLAAAFFVVLAPTSSFIPISTQTMAEHRTYPALIYPLLLLALPVFRHGGRWAAPLVLVCAGVGGGLTCLRNADYASAVRMWGDTARKMPANARAQYCLGLALYHAGRLPEAIAPLRQALELKTAAHATDLDVYANSLGVVLQETGDTPGAIACFQRAMDLMPRNEAYPNALASALVVAGRPDESLPLYRRALALRPDYPEALYNLANQLMRLGQAAEAWPLYRRALELAPEDFLAHLNYAVALELAGQPAASGPEYARAFALKPADARVLFNYATHLAQTGDPGRAIALLEQAVAIDPNHLPAHGNLASLYLAAGQPDRAAVHARAVLRLDPNNAFARDLLRRLPGS